MDAQLKRILAKPALCSCEPGVATEVLLDAELMSWLVFIFQYLYIEVSTQFLCSRYVGTHSDVVNLHGNQADVKKWRTIWMRTSANEGRTAQICRCENSCIHETVRCPLLRMDLVLSFAAASLVTYHLAKPMANRSVMPLCHYVKTRIGPIKLAVTRLNSSSISTLNSHR